MILSDMFQCRVCGGWYHLKVAVFVDGQANCYKCNTWAEMTVFNVKSKQLLKACQEAKERVT